MADRRLSTALRVRYRLTPWWAKVLVIFVASRVVSTIILLAYAARQEPNPWTGAAPGYFDFATMWDAHWYSIIAVAGYPSELPLTEDGHVGESAWAFMPAFPTLVRVLMVITGADFAVLAVIVSVGFALAAALMFYRLMRLVLPSGTALFAVVLFCFAPLSPLLQVAYAESMQLFLLALALYLLVRRRYWMHDPGHRGHGAHPAERARVRAHDAPARRVAVGARSHGAAESTRSRWASAWHPSSSAVFSAVMGIAWRARRGVRHRVAHGLHRHRARVALALHRARRAACRSRRGSRPPASGRRGSGCRCHCCSCCWVSASSASSPLLFTPAVRRLGPDIRFWLASYALYLLAVFFPQSSTFRLLMPFFPMLGAVALPRSRWYRAGVVAAFIAGQVALGARRVVGRRLRLDPAVMPGFRRMRGMTDNRGVSV